MRSRKGRVSGTTLNAAVVAFLDFSSGGAVGGASAGTSSRVATADPWVAGGARAPGGTDGRDYRDAGCRAAGPATGENPAGPAGCRPPGWTDRPGGLFGPAGRTLHTRLTVAAGLQACRYGSF